MASPRRRPKPSQRMGVASFGADLISGTATVADGSRPQVAHPIRYTERDIGIG